jgi:hypothetical protein
MSKMKTKRPKLPTEHQTRILRRIAASGCMMLTHKAGYKDRYTDGDGIEVADYTAKLMIRNGWLVPERDSMFDLTAQSWRVRTP